MSFNIWEYDFKTKEKTKNRITALQKQNPQKWRNLSFAFLKRVYENALQECPVDTGALRASHRIVEGENPNIARPADATKYVKELGLEQENPEWRLWLVAGGGGVINPKKNKEVDYAQAVHDRNPWLRRAFKQSLPYLERTFRLSAKE